MSYRPHGWPSAIAKAALAAPPGAAARPPTTKVLVGDDAWIAARPSAPRAPSSAVPITAPSGQTTRSGGAAIRSTARRVRSTWTLSSCAADTARPNGSALPWTSSAVRSAGTSWRPIASDPHAQKPATTSSASAGPAATPGTVRRPGGRPAAGVHGRGERQRQQRRGDRGERAQPRHPHDVGGLRDRASRARRTRACPTGTRSSPSRAAPRRGARTGPPAAAQPAPRPPSARASAVTSPHMAARIASMNGCSTQYHGPSSPGSAKLRGNQST